jgi:hypothetical protein
MGQGAREASYQLTPAKNNNTLAPHDGIYLALQFHLPQLVLRNQTCGNLVLLLPLCQYDFFRYIRTGKAEPCLEFPSLTAFYLTYIPELLEDWVLELGRASFGGEQIAFVNTKYRTVHKREDANPYFFRNMLTCKRTPHLLNEAG